MPAGIAAGHPATVEVGLRVLAGGGTAADAAVAAMLAACVGESVLTGVGGGGYATYFDAASGSVTCLDFFCARPGLDGDRTPEPMMPIEVTFGDLPMNYMIGGPSIGVPGVVAGAGEVHRRWGHLPWHRVVEPAITLAATGVVLPAAQARALAAVAPALVPGEGAAIYAPAGQLLRGGDLLVHPGLDATLATLAEEGPAAFYTGKIGQAMVEAVRDAGGVLGPADLAAYRVRRLRVGQARLAGFTVAGRHDLNQAIDTLAALPARLPRLDRCQRAVLLGRALLDGGHRQLGDTTNISVVDADGNACVVTLSLGLGSGVWVSGRGIHLNSMLGEGELVTGDLAPGQRVASMMCPLVVVDQAGALALAAGSAGASRIRTALIATLIGVLVDGRDVASAIDAPRFHAVTDDASPATTGVVHAEPDYPEDELAALADAGFTLSRWDHFSHYFGGVSAVGRAGAAGDPRRGGIGVLC